MSTPMSPNAPAGPEDFREQLSAWHDGALSAEASRFVLKRLLGDDGLRADVGRWQVIGDALRRQAQQPPSFDLAGRIGAAIDAEQASALAMAPSASHLVAGRGRPLRWLATAAALGLAAVLVWSPAPDQDGGDAVALVAAEPASSAPNTPPAPPSRPLPMPPRLAEVAPSSLIAAVPPLVRAPQPTPEQLAPLPAVDAPSRPWPRSASEQDAYTVEYRVPAPATSQQ